MDPSPSHPIPTLLARVRRWRRVALISGLTLAATFFLPAVDGCDDPVSPFVLTRDHKPVSDPLINEYLQWTLFLLTYTIPYVMGLMCSLVVIRIGWRGLGATGVTGHFFRVVFAAAWVGLLCLAVDWFAGPRPFRNLSALGVWEASYCMFRNRTAHYLAWQVIFVSLTVLMSAYHSLALLRGDIELLGARLWFVVCTLLWFGLVALTKTTYYGLWISLACSLAMGIAIVAEGCLRGVGPPGTAVLRLLTCHAKLCDLDDSRCRGCGYLLTGLTEPRCPECARPFDPVSQHLRQQ